MSTFVSFSFEVELAELDIALHDFLTVLQSGVIIITSYKTEKYSIWKTYDIATKYLLHSSFQQIYSTVHTTACKMQRWAA